jgi:hypothetical protein
MRRRILRWLAPLLIVGACVLPAAVRAQDTGIERGVKPEPGSATASDKPERTGGPAYVVAALIAILVLLPICMPSRKST